MTDVAGASKSTVGTLYVVATPIGNLDDMSARALKVLADVALIAAEDTRHSIRLLQHFGIDTPLAACHEHNERDEGGRFLTKLLAGENVALVSDAGTPLISDPGYHLVRQARAAGVNVVPVPGACALIAALSAAGLPSDRFIFEGFLPAKAAGRRARLEQVKEEPRTLIFYEAPHRQGTFGRKSLTGPRFSAIKECGRTTEGKKTREKSNPRKRMEFKVKVIY